MNRFILFLLLVATGYSADTLAGNLTVQKQVVLQGDLAVTITANQNNYNPTNLANAVGLNVTGSTDVTITGLAGGADGRVMFIVNKNTSGTVTLSSQSTSSTAANRFALPADVVLEASGGSILLRYDASAQRWVALGGAGSASAGGGGSGDGTVTSVAVSGSDGIEVDSGSPVTSSGTIALGLNVAATKTHLSLNNVTNTSDANKPVSTAQQTALDTKVDKNANITAATKTKITYGANGLVTAGADATTADIADSTNKRYVTDAQLTVVGNTSGTNTGDQDLSTYLVKNTAIVGATKTKVTYDTKGLVTAGADATTADIADSTNKRYVTDAQLVVVGNTSGTNTGDQTTVTGNAGTATALATGRTIGITGDVTYTSPSFDGSANVSAAATVTKINGVSLAGLGTGILKNTTATGVPSIAVAADFPTLNQSTTGSAATLTTARSIYGNNFNGSADLTQVIASTYGGTGNGFTKFTGPTTSEKTFTLPNASATILTDNAAVTVAQGGTGRATGTTAYGLIAAGTTATGAQQTLAAGATTEILVGGGASALPVWTTATGSGAPVRATSPTLVTPTLGAATATSLATGTLSTTGTATIQNGNGAALILGADNTASTLTNSTTKVSRIVQPHYTNTEEPLVLMNSSSQSATNVVSVGGGSSFFNAATQVDVYTAANNTTLVGTQVASFTSTGLAVTGAFSATGGSSQIMGDFSSSASDPYIRFGNSGGTIQGFMQALTAGSIGFGSTTNHPVVVRVNNTAIGTFASTGLNVAGIVGASYSGSNGNNILNTSDTSGTNFLLFYNSGGTAIGGVSRVTTTNAVTYNTTSDGRLKTNVRDYTEADAGKIIDGLKPRWFDWKTSALMEEYQASVVVDGKTTKVTKTRPVTDKAKLAVHAENNRSVIGFIAQEVAAVDPSLIKIGAVTVGDTDPNVISKQWQRSDVALVPIIVAEVKSLRVRVATLEAAQQSSNKVADFNIAAAIGLIACIAFFRKSIA